MSPAAVVAASAPSCKPNISAAGRGRRVRFGRTCLVAGFLLLGLFVATRAAWAWRILLFVPASLAAVGYLQAVRGTCIERAKEGTFERDDFSTVPAADDEVAASRAVAAGIRRDSILFGFLGAAVGVASALVR